MNTSTRQHTRTQAHGYPWPCQESFSDAEKLDNLRDVGAADGAVRKRVLEVAALSTEAEMATRDTEMGFEPGPADDTCTVSAFTNRELYRLLRFLWAKHKVRHAMAQLRFPQYSLC